MQKIIFSIIGISFFLTEPTLLAADPDPNAIMSRYKSAPKVKLSEFYVEGDKEKVTANLICETPPIDPVLADGVWEYGLSGCLVANGKNSIFLAIRFKCESAAKPAFKDCAEKEWKKFLPEIQKQIQQKAAGENKK